MSIERIDISDHEFESEILVMLEHSGFAPRRVDDVIHLEGLGIGHGDASVDIQIDLVSLDGHRILEILAPLRMPPVDFEVATLMCSQGNMSCLIAKFKPVEILKDKVHIVHAMFTLYADLLSEEELRSMLYLFIKEVDAIDNKLITMIKTR
jgi:hypothetical protein